MKTTSADSRGQGSGVRGQGSGARDRGSDGPDRSPLIPRAGVTLLELVVVIVILSLLLGLSLALFRNANRDLGVRASAGHLTALLRAARDQARAERAPTWVVVDTGENCVYAMTKETVGEWHFEDTVTTGAFGKNGRVSGQAQLVPGRVGMAYRMTGSSSIDCGEVPVYAADQGIVLEFWVQRVNAPGRQTLCAIGSQLEIAVEANGRMTARIGDLSLSSGDMLLRVADLWYHVRFIFSGSEAQLFVNNALVASKAGTVPWGKSASLVIGASKSGLQGVIDEFRVGIVLARERYYLPSEAKFELPQGYLARGQTRFVVHFDPEGRLDPRKHGQPLRIKIKSPTDEKEIVLPLTGLVQR